MTIKAIFKIREVAIPRGYRRLHDGETVQAGDFAFFSRGTEECDDPVWYQMTDQLIVGQKVRHGQEKQRQENWIIRRIE